MSTLKECVHRSSFIHCSFSSARQLSDAAVFPDALLLYFALFVLLSRIDAFAFHKYNRAFSIFFLCDSAIYLRVGIESQLAVSKRHYASHFTVCHQFLCETSCFLI